MKINLKKVSYAKFTVPYHRESFAPEYFRLYLRFETQYVPQETRRYHMQSQFFVFYHQFVAQKFFRPILIDHSHRLPQSFVYHHEKLWQFKELR